jgi:cysteine-rich repeat protein
MRKEPDRDFLFGLALFSILFISLTISFNLASAVSSWVQVDANADFVRITATYTERVRRACIGAPPDIICYPVLLDKNNQTIYMFTSPTVGFLSQTFISDVYDLPPGLYNYWVIAQDNVSNKKMDNKTFEILAPPPPPGCGDGKVNTSLGEECDDGNNVGGDGCSRNCKIEMCGNGRIDAGEECDKTDLNGQSCTTLEFLGGSLSCTNLCKFNTSKCTGAVVYCGDGIIDPGEECEGNGIVTNRRCSDIGNFTGGTLRCSNCHYDTNQCIGRSGGTCGDGIVAVGEQCDGGVGGVGGKNCTDINPAYTGGTLRCYTNNCTYDTRSCTTAQPYCLDGIKNGNEVCDTLDWGTVQSCSDLSGFMSGSLSCGDDCHLNTTNCVPYPPKGCNNGIVETGEECDINDLNGKSCATIGSGNFVSGTLKCASDCKFDTSSCLLATNFCGDGRVGGVEQCDGGIGNMTCIKLNDAFTDGTLKCNPKNANNQCMYNTSSCIGPTGGYCGNSQVEVSEQCDGSIEGKTCSNINPVYTGGNLGCNSPSSSSACMYDMSRCTKPEPRCGDGTINADDICDGNDMGNITDCKNLSGFVGGFLTCGKDCHLNTSRCYTGNETPHVFNDSCFDGNKSASETDVDCGGNCPPCGEGKKCSGNQDCGSALFCKFNICTATSCSDTLKNGLESDVDCGGGCPKCSVDKACNIDSDCASNFCHPLNKKCSSSTCDDTYLNGDESDVDCGGGCPNRCLLGQKCLSPNDCSTEVCEYGICSADKNKDSDDDGMPDWWEDKYGLDKNDPSDAAKDNDKDGRSNLDEYLEGTDPNVKDGFKGKSHTLQIILLIIGLLLMLGGIGFLIYSRKVLIPEQKARSKVFRGPPPLTPGQRGGVQQMPGRVMQRSGIRPGTPGTPGMQGAGTRLSQKESARKSLLESFNKDKDKAQTTRVAGSGATGSPADAKTTKLGEKPKDDFIHISELNKKLGTSKDGKEGSGAAGVKPGEKKLSGAFEKLKELAESYKNKKDAAKDDEAKKDDK